VFARETTPFLLAAQSTPNAHHCTRIFIVFVFLFVLHRPCSSFSPSAPSNTTMVCRPRPPRIVAPRAAHASHVPRTDPCRAAQALILEEGAFNHVLRIANTNVAGYHKIAYALTAVKGLGRRFSHQVCKAADIDTKKRSVSSLSSPSFPLPSLRA